MFFIAVFLFRVLKFDYSESWSSFPAQASFIFLSMLTLFLLFETTEAIFLVCVLTMCFLCFFCL